MKKLKKLLSFGKMQKYRFKMQKNLGLNLLVLLISIQWQIYLTLIQGLFSVDTY